METFSKKNKRTRERNENHTKTINAKTISKKSPQKRVQTSPVKSKQSKTPKGKTEKQSQEKVIQIKVPAEARARKATYSKQKQSKQNLASPKTTSAKSAVTMQSLSASSVKTAQKLPTHKATLNIATPNVNQTVPSPIPFKHVSNAGTNVDTRGANSTSVAEPSDKHGLVGDIDEINAFTREIFKFDGVERSSRHHEYLPTNRCDGTKPRKRSHRARLRCPTDQDDHLEEYIQSQNHCVDMFEEYVNTLKRPHGVIPNASIDPMNFNPGVSLIGPLVKKDPSVFYKQDSAAIKKIKDTEPRKRYALVHEKPGIFIIGGYNLYADVPVQREPDADYLIKFNGQLIKLTPLKPSRVHFGIYSDGAAIYIAGGQTIHNELLDDIQRMNLETFKWEHVATLTNPIATCGMTIEDNRIYLVGGYDFLLNQTCLLSDYTIYNLTTRQFEKGADLPSPRCRSLIFAADGAIFCVSGLIETRNESGVKKMTICRDILKWTSETAKWIKVSETPELTSSHALVYNDPYLEITKRLINVQDDGLDAVTEAYYNFRTNVWMTGEVPAPSTSAVPPQKTTKIHSLKSRSPSKAKSSPKQPNKTPSKVIKAPSKSKSPSKTKK